MGPVQPGLQIGFLSWGGGEVQRQGVAVAWGVFTLTVLGN